MAVLLVALQVNGLVDKMVVGLVVKMVGWMDF